MNLWSSKKDSSPWWFFFHPLDEKKGKIAKIEPISNTCFHPSRNRDGVLKNFFFFLMLEHILYGNLLPRKKKKNRDCGPRNYHRADNIMEASYLRMKWHQPLGTRPRLNWVIILVPITTNWWSLERIRHDKKRLSKKENKQSSSSSVPLLI